MKIRALKKGMCLFLTVATVISSSFSIMADDKFADNECEFTEDVSVDAAGSIELKNPKENEKEKMVWDSIYFGNYWQTDTNNDGKADKKDEKQPIKWRVLSVSGNDAFIISDRILDYKAFCDESELKDITWENSTIRSWLNGYGATVNAAGKDCVSSNFINEAFSAAEQDAIAQTQVKNDYVSEEGISNGNNTVDKIYLLSKDEITNPRFGMIGNIESAGMFSPDGYYIAEHKKRLYGKNTPYVIDLGASTSKSELYINNGTWILRTFGKSGSDYIDCVSTSLITSGARTTYEKGIRPVMHIDLTKADYSYAGEVIEGEVTDTDFIQGQADPENDNYALDTSSGNIKKLVLDLSDAGKYGLKNDITISVIHGSKITIKQPVESIESVANALEKNIKLNKKTNICTINAKKTKKYGAGFATIVTTDGQVYNIRIKIWRPQVQNWVKKGVSDRSDYTDKRIAIETDELFLTGIEGKVTATADGTDVTVDDRGQWIFFDANPGAKVTIQYEYLNKKYKTTIKMKKVKQ